MWISLIKKFTKTGIWSPRSVAKPENVMVFINLDCNYQYGKFISKVWHSESGCGLTGLKSKYGYF